MSAGGQAGGKESGFTLDPALRAQRKEASGRRMHTVVIPVIRAIGFAILSAIALLHDASQGGWSTLAEHGWLLTLNAAYALLSWLALRIGHARTGRVDLSLAFLHVDVLMWLVILNHIEHGHPAYAYLLLVRVADQVGFGFRRALYFAHVVVLAYLGYAAFMAVHEPAVVPWADRLATAAIMYLIGIYLAFTGSVMERLRNRLREAVRAGHELVDRLEQKTQALEVQTQDLERARLQAEQAKQERDQAQQRLFISLSEILDTRREARGMIVNLSDVLFDFNKASLKPGAREKLSKLAGILLAYPGGYRIEIEGHTDAIGSEEYNLKLSQARAESVCEYLKQSSIAADRIIAVRGFGKSKPVASNDSDAGRQVNRRVEIIIADADLKATQSER